MRVKASTLHRVIKEESYRLLREVDSGPAAQDLTSPDRVWSSPSEQGWAQAAGRSLQAATVASDLIKMKKENHIFQTSQKFIFRLRIVMVMFGWQFQTQQLELILRKLTLKPKMNWRSHLTSPIGNLFLTMLKLYFNTFH